MRKSELLARVSALEAIPAAAVVDEAAGAIRRENAQSAILELIKRLDREKAEYAALDAAGRIRHWLRELKEAEDYVAAYSDSPPPEFTDSEVAPGVDKSMWQLDLKSRRDMLEGGETHFELTVARLDRLAELGYHDQAELQEWNALRRRFEDLPWQWRKNYVVFPDDALDLIEAAG